MCRHAGYIGPRTAVAPVLTEMDHSLLHQSYLPRELLDGQTVNADGFGLAWYDPEIQPEPARYANPFPIWSDPGLPSMGRLIQSPVFLAAVRNATVAGANAPSNNAPFVDGRWSWSLNGYLSDFANSWRLPILQDWIAPNRHGRVKGDTDAEWLFQAFLSRLDQGEEPTQALRSLSRDVHAHARDADVRVQLNLLASDGTHLYATRDGNQDACNSLYHLQDGEEFPGAHVVASEPLMDDPEWVPVEPGSLLVLQADAPPVRLSLHA